MADYGFGSYDPQFLGLPADGPEIGFTSRFGGLLTDPPPEPAGGLLGPAPELGFTTGPVPLGAALQGDGAPAPPGLLARLFGGGDPERAREMLISLGAGLLRSGGRIEGLGEGAMQGLQRERQSRTRAVERRTPAAPASMRQRNWNDWWQPGPDGSLHPVAAAVPAPLRRHFAGMPYDQGEAAFLSYWNAAG